MRERALAAARLDRRDLNVLDAGAGTGFTTEGIVAAVDPSSVTMLDQSPHQLARAARRPALAGVRRLLGDAEALPFADDSFDRYVSAGSIEYWPDPQRGIAEAYRVLRPGGVALVVGPVQPAGRLARALADLWMLFPSVEQYRTWFERAGFADVEVVPVAPDWYRDTRVPVRGRGGRGLRRRRAVARRGSAGDRGARRAAERFTAIAVGGAVRGRLAGRPGVRADRAGHDAAGAAGALLSSQAAVVRRTGAATVLWRFSRPHTLLGTFISAAGLYVIAVAELPGSGLDQLFWVMVAGAGVNVAIVGVNQITDVEIDRINKPHLPLAAGDLSREAAWWIVAVAALVPVVLALTQGALELAAVIAALAVGAAYSLPPVRLKRFPLVASLCISGVRAIAVNLGMYGHFSLAFGDGSLTIPPAVWALTAFVLPFSFAIAVLKDVPDLEGDRRFRIATFTVRLGAQRAAQLGIGGAGGRVRRDDRPRAAAGGRRRRPRARGRPRGRARAARGVGAPCRPLRLQAVLHARVGVVLRRVRAHGARRARS